MKILKTIIVLIVASVWVWGCAPRPPQPTAYVPLPQDLKIIPPDPKLPPTIKAFSGMWYGLWDETLEHILVVEEINPPYVIAIYAQGGVAPAPKFRAYQPSWHRVRGEIKEGAVVFSLPRPATLTYTMRPDGKLAGRYLHPYRSYHAEMTRWEQ